jgi:hypothetical protein
VQQYCQFESTDSMIIYLETSGGEMTWAKIISSIILGHVGVTQVNVPTYALSAGTVISLAADSIVMSDVGVLGPIDPYVYGLNVIETERVLKENLGSDSGRSWFSTVVGQWSISRFLGDYGWKMMGRIRQDHKACVMNLLKRYDAETAQDIYKSLTQSHHHCTAIMGVELIEMGIRHVSVDFDMSRRKWKEDNAAIVARDKDEHDEMHGHRCDQL